jgi:hypothetical protein
MALRTKDKVAKNPEGLVRWMKGLNPGLHMDQWRSLDRWPESKSRWLFSLKDWNSAKIVKETSYKISTGCTQGIVKVPSDPKAGTQRGRGVTVGPIIIIRN